MEYNNSYSSTLSQFIVRLRTSDNQWAGAGEEVKININGMIYTRYTNETDHTKLSINLIKGVYVVTTYYKDCRNSDTIVVLPTLITGDLEMKYRDGSSFIIKTLDKQGNPMANQYVTMNINGVIYERTTNSNGAASLLINLQAGEYIITTQYGTEQYSNTILIEAY